jgi:hypothetical protein
VCCFLGPLFFDRGPGYIRRVPPPPSSCFSVSGGWGGGACQLVVCFCYCFASCFSSVSTKSGHFMFVVTVQRITVCVSVKVILLTVFCGRWLLASFRSSEWASVRV